MGCETGIQTDTGDCYNDGYGGTTCVNDISTDPDTAQMDITTPWGGSYNDVFIDAGETWEKTNTQDTYEDTYSVTVNYTYSFSGKYGADYDVCFSRNIYEYHLDNLNGSDSNDGRDWAHAWATLSHAANNIPSGKTLHIASGDYREAPGSDPVVAPVNAGSGSSAVVYSIEDHNSKGFVHIYAGEEVSYKHKTFEYSPFGSAVWYYFDYDGNYNGMNWINGYNDSSCNFVVLDIHLGSGKLAYVFNDKEPDEMWYTGSTVTLDDGWAVEIISVDSDGDKAYLKIIKNSEVMDEYFVTDDETLVHTETVDGEDFPVIVIHVDAVWRGSETNGIQIAGLWQVSDWYVDNTGVDTSHG